MTTTALPALTGSDNQITWATDLRARALDHLAETDIPADVREATRALLTAVTEASWWIDTRNAGLIEPGWPAHLGITTPAVELYPPTKPRRPLAAARLAARMTTAQQVRDLLDAAGVARTSYFLYIDRMDSLRIELRDVPYLTQEQRESADVRAVQLLTVLGDLIIDADSSLLRKGLRVGQSAMIRDAAPAAP